MPLARFSVVQAAVGPPMLGVQVELRELMFCLVYSLISL